MHSSMSLNNIWGGLFVRSQRVGGQSTGHVVGTEMGLSAQKTEPVYKPTSQFNPYFPAQTWKY